jgi:hypothetical protein
MIRFGDTVAKVAQPIARGIDFTFGTKVAECPGCKNRQNALNNFSDRLYDRFWKRNGNDMEKTEYMVVVSVMATDPYDDKLIEINKYLKDKGCGILAVNPRPPGVYPSVVKTNPA